MGVTKMGKTVKLGMRKKAYDDEIMDFIIEASPGIDSKWDDLENIIEEVMYEWGMNLFAHDEDFDPSMWETELTAALEGFLDNFLGLSTQDLSKKFVDILKGHK